MLMAPPRRAAMVPLARRAVPHLQYVQSFVTYFTADQPVPKYMLSMYTYIYSLYTVEISGETYVDVNYT